MNTQALERSFSQMGARVKFGELSRWARSSDPTFDVSRDEKGEYFFIRHNPSDQTELVVLDVQPKDRHLLLLTKKLEGHRAEKHRYLMGHDERHWFVAGIPEQTPVSRVLDAKAALKPPKVMEALQGVKAKHHNKRHNEAFVRQGEWFFVRRPSLVIENRFDSPVLRDEPLIRGRGSKPHTCSHLYRSGGETVYVTRAYPDGLIESQYNDLSDKERRSHNWTVMKRNPSVWVKGTVRHSDHATIVLDCWHEVFSNTENLSFAMRNIVFLD